MNELTCLIIQVVHNVEVRLKVRSGKISIHVHQSKINYYLIYRILEQNEDPFVNKVSRSVIKAVFVFTSVMIFG